MVAQRTLLASLAVLCAAGLAWFAAGGAGLAAPPLTIAPADAVAVPEALESLTAYDLAQTGSPPSTSSTTEAKPTRRGVEVTSDGSRLTVVLDATGKPFAGAEVFASERPNGSRANRVGNNRANRTGNNRISNSRADRGRGRNQRHWAHQLVTGARPRRTDARGEVALPPTERQLYVAARAPGLFGVARFAANATNPTIRLQPDESVHVRVVDGAGRPRAAVRVVLCVDRGARLTPKDAATTDRDGIATLEHVQLSREKAAPRDAQSAAMLREVRAKLAGMRQLAAARSGNRNRGTTRERRNRLRLVQQQEDFFRQQLRANVRSEAQARRALPQAARANLANADFIVTAEVPQLRPAAACLPGGVVPNQLIELRLAATGSLVVRLRGPDDQVLHTPCEVIVRAAKDTPAAGSVRPQLAASLREITASRAAKPIGRGWVRFDHIGGGLTLDVAVRFADDDFDFGRQGLRGPSASATVELELDVPGWFTVLSGRLVDATGTPLGDLRPTMFLAGGSGHIEVESVATTPDGRFELPFKIEKPTPPHTLEVHVDRGAQQLGALLTMAELRPGHRHELGDVPLAALPALATGTVRDDTGKPLAGVRVTLESHRVAAAGKGRWLAEANVNARTDELGRYQLFGPHRSGQLRVQARRRGYSTATRPLAAFGAECDFTLDRLGELVGDGHHPDWMPRGALRVQLWQNGKQLREEALRSRAGVFTFRLANLRRGQYDVSLVLRGVPRPVVVVRGLQVLPGQPTADPRLSNLELAGALFRYVVQAVDQADKPVRSRSPLLVHLTDSTGAPKTVGYPWRGAQVEFFAADPSVEVVALATGHAPVRQLLQPGATRLTLTRLHPLQVDIPGLRQLVGPDRRVRLSMVFAGDTGLPMTDFTAIDQRNGRDRGYPRAMLGKSNGAWLGKQDRMQVRLMVNGRYAVIARLHEGGVRGAVSVELGRVDAVLDGTEPQTVRVPLQPSLIEGALTELMAKKAAAPARQGSGRGRSTGRR